MDCEIDPSGYSMSLVKSGSHGLLIEEGFSLTWCSLATVMPFRSVYMESVSAMAVAVVSCRCLPDIGSSLGTAELPQPSRDSVGP